MYVELWQNKSIPLHAAHELFLVSPFVGETRDHDNVSPLRGQKMRAVDPSIVAIARSSLDDGPFHIVVG